jgi:rare lipoprotein A
MGWWGRVVGGIAIACALIGGVAEAQGRKTFSGMASYYGDHYRGRTAQGERYDPTRFTAAHRTLPFGTRVRVTNPRNHETVTVVVNDRGPFIKGRVLDLSLAAAKALHITGRGIAHVTASVE